MNQRVALFSLVISTPGLHPFELRMYGTTRRTNLTRHCRISSCRLTAHASFPFAVAFSRPPQWSPFNARHAPLTPPRLHYLLSLDDSTLWHQRLTSPPWPPQHSLTSRPPPHLCLFCALSPLFRFSPFFPKRNAHTPCTPNCTRLANQPLKLYTC